MSEDHGSAAPTPSSASPKAGPGLVSLLGFVIVSALLLTVALTSPKRLGLVTLQSQRHIHVYGRIQWLSQLKQAQALARKHSRPILFTTATPHFRGVPGLWSETQTEAERRFYFHPKVIEASRRYICVRLSTYEDADELAFTRSLLEPGQSLGHGLFCLLDARGQKLCEAAPTPAALFGSAAQLAQEMQTRAPTPSQTELVGIPAVANLRLALNVAAADRMRLVVLFKDSAITKHLSKCAWTQPFIGRFHFVVCDKQELEKWDVNPDQADMIILDHSEFGLRAKELARLSSDAKLHVAEAMLKMYRSLPPSNSDYWGQIRKGQSQGLTWKTALPMPTKQ